METTFNESHKQRANHKYELTRRTDNNGKLSSQLNIPLLLMYTLWGYTIAFSAGGRGTLTEKEENLAEFD